jgi:hypothetical protein
LNSIVQFDTYIFYTCPQDSTVQKGVFYPSNEYFQIFTQQIENMLLKSNESVNFVLYPQLNDTVNMISRILSIPKGHLILFGLPSAGKLSISQMIVSLFNLKQFHFFIHHTYSLDDWKKDLKQLIDTCGRGNQKAVLFLRESDLKFPRMIQDVQNLFSGCNLEKLYNLSKNEPNEIDFSHCQSNIEKIFKSEQFLFILLSILIF